MKYNANINFTSPRGHNRLALLAALKGKTLGDTIKDLLVEEFKRLGLKISKWGKQ